MGRVKKIEGNMFFITVIIYLIFSWIKWDLYIFSGSNDIGILILYMVEIFIIVLVIVAVLLTVCIKMKYRKYAKALMYVILGIIFVGKIYLYDGSFLQAKINYEINKNSREELIKKFYNNELNQNGDTSYVLPLLNKEIQKLE